MLTVMRPSPPVQCDAADLILKRQKGALGRETVVDGENSSRQSYKVPAGSQKDVPATGKLTQTPPVSYSRASSAAGSDASNGASLVCSGPPVATQGGPPPLLLITSPVASAAMRPEGISDSGTARCSSTGEACWTHQKCAPFLNRCIASLYS